MLSEWQQRVEFNQERERLGGDKLITLRQASIQLNRSHHWIKNHLKQLKRQLVTITRNQRCRRFIKKADMELLEACVFEDNRLK